jgi:peptidyl-prolyl cis-trans isomerase D
MFDLVHENKKLIQIVLALIILPFALWGVSSYERSGNTAVVVATVNGTKITQQEFQNALSQQQDRMRKQLGANFDVAILDNPAMKRALIDNLVAQRLLVDHAKAERLIVPDDRVAQLIGGIDAFQDNGKFDKKRYESVLAMQQMSPLIFEARLRDELLGQQMQDAYAQNGFAAKMVADNIVHLSEQQRVVRVSIVQFQPFMTQAKVDEAALKKYYEQNPKEFQVQEQARVEFAKFSVDDLLAKVEVTTPDAQKYYDDHSREFGAAEERRAAHILVSVSAAATQAEQDVAKSKAEQLLQQVRQNPAKFAELAKQNSQDPGSAVNGGDLGFFGRGQMVKPFEDATFSLKQGEISGLVKSDFGYHIIKLTAIKPARVPAFDEVREGIVNKLRQQKASDMFAEMAEKFSNAAYEQSDTLKPAADLVGAKIEKSGWLNKRSAAGEPWTAKMLQAIFNDEVVKNKRNTAAIEVATNTLVAARILEYKPASVRTFGDVQDTIRQKLMQQQALELAVKQGKALLEQLQGGNMPPTLSWGATQSVTRAQHGTLEAGLVRQIFQANTAKLPQFVGAETGQSGYVLVRIDAVNEGEAASEEKRARYMQQLRQLTGEEMSRAYLSDAKQHASINVNLPEAVLVQP